MVITQYLNLTNTEGLTMYAEITKKLFDTIISIDHKTTRVENSELASRAYYQTRGCELLRMDHYTTCTSQYFIKDINA